MLEIWKDIPQRPGYQASSEGRIRSIEREINWKSTKRIRKGKILTPYRNRRGYLEVRVAFGIRSHRSGLAQTIHKLVMWAFKPEKGENTQVNHINGIKTDNKPDNLEWCTNGQNGKHAYDMGLKPKLTGERNGRVKLTWVQVREIRTKYIKKYGALKALSLEYGVTSSNIIDIINQKTWVEN